MDLSDIADEIFTELAEPSDISVASIMYWLETNTGQLNAFISTSFVSTSTTITPDPSGVEKQIFKMLYTAYYYRRQMNRNLGAAALVGISEVKEGNRTVKRFDRTSVAKSYKSLIDDVNRELTELILAYKLEATEPVQFIVESPVLAEQAEVVHDAQSTE